MKKRSTKQLLNGSTLFFFAVIIVFLIVGWQISKRPAQPQTQQPQENNISNTQGTFSNADFSMLIEDNLAALGFVNNIRFQGKGEGQFSVSGTFCDPARLTAVCSDLKPFEAVLTTLKDETITINGHLGQNEQGKGCFVADTITFSGITVPAGIATAYIDQFTALNDLLDVPYEQIVVSENGIRFSQKLPGVIQTALCK